VLLKLLASHSNRGFVKGFFLITHDEGFSQGICHKADAFFMHY